MTCRNCGREIVDGSVFCPHCGTTQAPAPESPVQGATPPWEGPEGGGKKKKTGLLIGIGAAVVAVIALVAVFAGGLFSSPKKQVEKAFVKSTAAYVQAGKKLNLPDVERWQKDQKITQNMGLELESINSDLIGYDLSALSGLGVGMLTSYSGADRWASCELRGWWGNDELLNLSVKADGGSLFFNSPQLTGDTHYGVNTETLGADLTAMTGDDSMEDLSFNLFDLVDLALEKMDQGKLKQDMIAATKSLWDQAEVKKTGNNKTQVIHGTSVKTTAYQVTIPQEALHRYVDDLETALSAWDYAELYEEMFRSMGMPREAVQDFLDQLESVDPYGQLADGLREAVDKLGDVELDVRLSGGYVSGVLYEDEIDGHPVNAALILGGGTEYVDDLGLELMVDDLKLRIDSAGDHSVRGNLFADTTTIQLNDKSSCLLKVTSDLTLDPAKKEDNFQWTLEDDNSGLIALDVAGDADWSQDYLSLNLDSITLKVMGIDVCTLTLSYHVENGAGAGTVENPKIITRMDEQELMAMVLETQSNTLAWSNKMEELFVSRLPAELLWALMSDF